MKSLIIIFFITFAFLLKCNSQKISSLGIAKHQIVSVFDEVLKKEGADSIKSGFYVLKIDKYNSLYELRMANFSKAVLKLYLADRSDSIQGYIRYRGFTILVYGKYIETFFIRNDNSKIFEFTEKKVKLTRKGKSDTPPPNIIEPTVWIYNIVNEKLIFKDAGYFKLLQ